MADSPDGRPIRLLRWQHLSLRQRREVFRLAQEGRPHPDRQVSAAALAWARGVLDTQSGMTPVRWLAAAVSGTTATFDEYNPMMRRRARRVAAANAGDGVGPEAAADPPRPAGPL